MPFLDFMNRMLRPKTNEFSWFDIQHSNFINQAPPEGAFKKDKTYFEIVVHTIFLRDQREYWAQYRPLGITLTRFIYGGSHEEMPFLIGPQLLGKLEQVKEGDHIVYRNVRVAGPQPYMGDWVHLFTGLWRCPTRNLAQEVISFAETIGAAIQTPQLSICLAVARPLVNGLEKLLKMDGLELRIGYVVGYTAELGPSRFRPGYFAMVRAPKIDKTKFWVKEDRLHFGETEKSTEPYADADHMLFSIRRLEKREDITTFPFFKYYKEAVQKIWEDKDVEADASRDRFFIELAGSPDFTHEHRWKLVSLYQERLETEKRKREVLKTHKWLSKDERNNRLQKAGLDSAKQAIDVADLAGLEQTKQSMKFVSSLLRHDLDSILWVGEEGEPTEDELAGSVLDYPVEDKAWEYDPEKLRVELGITKDLKGSV